MRKYVVLIQREGEESRLTPPMRFSRARRARKDWRFFGFRQTELVELGH